jgi:predicted GNAT superfamily acetyltransferase
MKSDCPTAAEISALRALWKEAFGDSDEFLNDFFSTAFSPDRSRRIEENGRILSALYWFDCSYSGGKLAYLYAVATAKSARGRGLCRTLMEDTHRHLRSLGYVGAILVPAEPSLYGFYRRMGYADCTSVREFTVSASNNPIALRVLEREEYRAHRRTLLPTDAVLQENENLDFWATQASFFATDDALFTAWIRDGELICSELLGSTDESSRIVSALGCSNGSFRTVGSEKPFTLWYPLKDNLPAPTYFGLSFD